MPYFKSSSNFKQEFMDGTIFMFFPTQYMLRSICWIPSSNIIEEVVDGTIHVVFYISSTRYMFSTTYIYIVTSCYHYRVPSEWMPRQSEKPLHSIPEVSRYFMERKYETIMDNLWLQSSRNFNWPLFNHNTINSEVGLAPSHLRSKRTIEEE